MSAATVVHLGDWDYGTAWIKTTNGKAVLIHKSLSLTLRCYSFEMQVCWGCEDHEPPDSNETGAWFHQEPGVVGWIPLFEMRPEHLSAIRRGDSDSLRISLP